MITANQPFGEWNRVFPEPNITHCPYHRGDGASCDYCRPAPRPCGAAPRACTGRDLAFVVVRLPDGRRRSIRRSVTDLVVACAGREGRIEIGASHPCKVAATTPRQ
jgi:hypothetical protein